MVTAHSVVVLEMADHRLDGGATPHLAADGFGDAANLAADPDLEPVGIVVAAIALVAVDAARCDTCELFEIGDDGRACGRHRDCRAGPWHAARTARLWARWQAWQSRLCSQTRKVPGPCLCRCTPPRGRATSRPWDRADAAPDGEPGRRDRAADQSDPQAQGRPRSCV